MAKKTKAGQRSKEEQWRKRMAAQSRRGAPAMAGSTAVVDGDVDSELLDETTDYEAAEPARAAAPVARPTPQRAARADSAAHAATQRRSYSTARANRVRLAANPLTIEEEMHYVRSDIRNLIILTALCVAVLIVLAFLIR